jgi:hypothetical protein
MKSGGKTAEIKVGRQILCKEKPSTRATSTCAKQLTKTVKAAKQGLTAQQQKLWRRYVYTPAVLQVKLFCDKRPRSSNNARRGNFKLSSCEEDVLAGKTKFRDLFGKKFKWSDFLVNGAKMIKKVPLTFKGGTQPSDSEPNAWEQ